MFEEMASVQLSSVRPGPGLAGLLAGPRETLPLGSAAPPDPVDELAAWQRLACWVDAGLNDAMIAVAGGFPQRPEEEDWGREEVATALAWSANYASDRLELARTLATRLTATRTALREGRISLRHAADIARILQPLTDDELINRAERAILDKAPGRTVAQLARIARREAMKHDPRSADARHKAARAQRRVEFTPMPDGMVELRAYLPADDATRLRAAIDRLAGRSRAKGDHRTIDQRRADALSALVTHASTSTGTGTGTATGTEASAGRQAAPLRVGLVAPLATVTGQADLPGELVGYGPIPPALVRELAGTEGARWEKWLTDSGGIVTDLGRTTYRPSAALAALVRATHPTCVFPGCSQPSYRCDLDHTRRWTDGGSTSATNLAPLCRRHHRAKDEAGWQLDRRADGTFEWTSPAGHTYTVEPHSYATGPAPETAVGHPADAGGANTRDAGPGSDPSADDQAPPF